jgi:demethylmenaquinone methyltransferase / 2-methoxy-6-polyprenyl-1,4-benzoquinol methylase
MPTSPQQFTRPESETSIAQMFDRISGRYDLLNRLLSARQDVRWRQHLLAMIPYRPAGTYLDMATGTGDVVIAAAKKHPEYASFVGGDISKGMLSVARVKSGAAGLNKSVEWRQISAENINLDSATCDCVSISFGLRNVVNKERALYEFSRVLKGGGVLLILEFFTPENGLMSKLFQFYFHQILPIIGRLMSEREAYNYLPQSVTSFYSPSHLRDSLHNKGFMIESEKSFLFGGCRLVKAIKT